MDLSSFINYMSQYKIEQQYNILNSCLENLPAEHQIMTLRNLILEKSIIEKFNRKLEMSNFLIITLLNDILYELYYNYSFHKDLKFKYDIYFNFIHTVLEKLKNT